MENVGAMGSDNNTGIDGSTKTTLLLHVGSERNESLNDWDTETAVPNKMFFQAAELDESHVGKKLRIFGMMLETVMSRPFCPDGG